MPSGTRPGIPGPPGAADLEVFLAERGTALLRSAVLLAGSREAGEDLLQAGLERMLRRWRAINGDPEGYLRRTIYNLAADGWRRQRRWRDRLHLIQQPKLMSDDLEQLLSDGLRRRTAQIQLEPGLGARAHKHRRLRRKRARAAAALGVTATIGVAALRIALTAQNYTAGTVTVRTAAYVISHSEQALAAAAANDPVITLRSPDWGQGIGFDMNPAHGVLWQQTYMWFHDGQSRTEGLTSAGQPVYDLGSDQVNVDYPAKVWWREAQASSATPPSTSKLTCEDVRYFAIDGFLEQYATDIRKALSCGLYTTDGTEQVNGTDAIKLTPVKPKANAPTAILWLDPATYLPIKIAVETFTGKTMQPVQTEYIEWLAPTPANLADLTPPVPAGFTRIPPPPAAGGCALTTCMQAYEKKVEAWYDHYLARRK